VFSFFNYCIASLKSVLNLFLVNFGRVPVKLQNVVLQDEGSDFLVQQMFFGDDYCFIFISLG
jgi:hypothetical protein